MTLVSIAMPVRHAPDTLGRALGSIARQTHAEFELLLVLNGSDEATERVATDAADRDGRIRLVRPQAANLAWALNIALREARGDLVARMDADDECPPERLARQVEAMRKRPNLAALGCAWECVRPEGRGVDTIRPACDEREARWRLLLGNTFAHGSMLLRKDAVLRVGGYDERLERAQDFDLWLRLAGRVGAIPDVLYRHHLRQEASYASCPVQAAVTGWLLTRAWASLPERGDPEPEIALSVALGEKAGAGEALRRLEDAMTQRGPTRSLLNAYQWIRANAPHGPRHVEDLCREARIREVGRSLAGQGVERLWLYGAGAHSADVRRVLGEIGLTVEGLADDALAGAERHGYVVASPDAIPVGATLLLSSVAHEDALWEASRALRERGVQVHRIYATTDAARSSA